MRMPRCCLYRLHPPIEVIDQRKLRQLRAAGEQKYFWNVGQTIQIKFLGGTQDQHAKVKKWASEWLQYANVKFDWVESGFSHIRITFDELDGAWSYLGIVAEVINDNEPTMNLGWLDKATVLHEFGHMLGLIHEHQNPLNGIQWNFAAIKADLGGPPNFWDDATIHYNITEQYADGDIIGTNVDATSIMMYPIPASWTLDGFSADFNEGLSKEDKGFIGFIYPFVTVVDPVEPEKPIEPEEEEPLIVETEVKPFDEEAFLVALYREMFPTYQHIKKMYEYSVVVMAKSLGIEAHMRDREIVTVRKIYKKLYPANGVGHIV